MHRLTPGKYWCRFLKSVGPQASAPPGRAIHRGPSPVRPSSVVSKNLLRLRRPDDKMLETKEKQPPSPVIRHPSSVARRPSPVARRPSPVARRPSPVARRPSPVDRRPSTVARRRSSRDKCRLGSRPGLQGDGPVTFLPPTTHILFS